MQVSRMVDDRVLVRVRPMAPDVTPSGILGVSQGFALSNEADVLEVGPGKLNKRGNRVPMDVVPGQCVLLRPLGPGAPLPGECVDEQERLYVVREKDILGEMLSE